jgi:molybdate transport system substrate-binding protein
MLAVLAAGCGDSGGAPTGAAASNSTRPIPGEVEPEGEVLVFAAASLTDAFAELADAFEEENPKASVTFNFGPSSGLASSINEGAPADVFASANQTQMDNVTEAGATAGESRAFARNVLEIAIPPDNPGEVEGLGDFAQDDLLIGLCAVDVPCGDFGRQVLERAGVTPAVDTNETNVRALLTKVELGELDAGLVYRTDVRSAGDAVTGIEIPEVDNVVATYPIAALAEAPNPEAADAFVAFVHSDEGQAVLESFGFLRTAA